MPNGDPVTNFDVAVRMGKDKTIWVRCDAWGDWYADTLAQYLLKGTVVGVTGQAYARAYIHKESGEARSQQCLRVDKINLLGGEAQEGQRSPQTQRQAEPQQAAQPKQEGFSGGFDDSEIPFAQADRGQVC